MPAIHLILGVLKRAVLLQVQFAVKAHPYCQQPFALDAYHNNFMHCGQHLHDA